MIWLILGMIIWWGAHLFKRVAPAARDNMQDSMGDASKGIVAVALVAVTVVPVTVAVALVAASLVSVVTIDLGPSLRSQAEQALA
ncbi:MAG: hypothetical protein HRU32_07900, partial [Rhodobacteraceae bacterium]|nr:hypothetical protein [Paracoccaceae bacterium]